MDQLSVYLGDFSVIDSPTRKIGVRAKRVHRKYAERYVILGGSLTAFELKKAVILPRKHMFEDLLSKF